MRLTRALDAREEHERRGGLVAVTLDLVGVLAVGVAVDYPVWRKRPDEHRQEAQANHLADDLENTADHTDLLQVGGDGKVRLNYIMFVFLMQYPD